MLEMMRALLIRAALDILRLENRVSELEDRCRIPVAERFHVRGPMVAGKA